MKCKLVHFASVASKRNGAARKGSVVDGGGGAPLPDTSVPDYTSAYSGCPEIKCRIRLATSSIFCTELISWSKPFKEDVTEHRDYILIA